MRRRYVHSILHSNGAASRVVIAPNIRKSTNLCLKCAISTRFWNFVCTKCRSKIGKPLGNVDLTYFFRETHLNFFEPYEVLGLYAIGFRNTFVIFGIWNLRFRPLHFFLCHDRRNLQNNCPSVCGLDNLSNSSILKNVFER